MTFSSTHTRAPRPWWVALVSGLAAYIDGAALSAMGTAIVIYQLAFDLSAAQVALTSSALTLGFGLGALFSGPIADRAGRRPTFTVTMIVAVIGSVLLVVAPSFGLVLAGALLLGLGAGADLPVAIATISEAATDENRGRLIGFSTILWSFGIVSTIVVSIVFGNHGLLATQVLFGHIGVVAVVVLILRLTIPESAVWLRARQERREGVRNNRTETSSVRDLFRGPYLRPTLGLLIMVILIAVSLGSFVNFSTYVLVTYAGVDVSTSSLIGLAFLPIGFIGSLVFMKVADGPRRNKWFRFGAIAYVVGFGVLAVAGISVPSFAIAGLFILLANCFAGEAIQRIWAAESYPTLIRASAQGVIASVSRFAGLIASLTPVLLAAVGPNLVYGAMAVVTAGGMAAGWIVFTGKNRGLVANQAHSETTTDAAGPDVTHPA